MYHRLNKLAEWISTGLALAGGIVLLGIVVISCVSIAGRALLPLGIGAGPIRGIYDFTEIGMATAIFAFLPWAQFQDAHARVDLFEKALSPKINKGLDLLFNILMFIVAFIGTHRLYRGMQDKLAFGETTLIAQIPVWQGYALSLIGGVGFCFVAAFCCLRSLRRLTGLKDDPEGETT